MVKSNLRHMALLWFAIILTACAITPSQERVPSLRDNLDHAEIVQFPLKTTAHGRWAVSVDLGEGKMADMILDTGATYSAFFNHAVERFNLNVDTENLTRIHGLVTNSLAANTKIERFGFGQDYFYNKNFAVLPQSENKTDDLVSIDGIIGMDIMEAYRIFVDVSQAKVYFIPNHLPEFRPPIDMINIPLFSNPYTERAPRLHFFTLGVKYRNIPALLDTGTDVHIINWHAASFVEARAIRAQLKWHWTVSGAVGDFKPVARAHVEHVNSGKYKWEDVNMVIKETDSLELIALANEPAIIAGIGLFDNRDVYLDFQSDMLWLQDNSASFEDTRIITICQSC